MTPAQLLSSIAAIAGWEVKKIEKLSTFDPGVLIPEHMEALLKLSKIARAAMDTDAEEDPGTGMSDAMALSIVTGNK